jgi:hypothetical protein
VLRFTTFQRGHRTPSQRRRDRALEAAGYHDYPWKQYAASLPLDVVVARTSPINEETLRMIADKIDVARASLCGDDAPDRGAAARRTDARTE